MKLVVMLITISIQNPATISGFDTLAACRAAEPTVAAFYRRTARSTTIAIECVELPRAAAAPRANEPPRPPTALVSFLLRDWQ